MRHKYTQEDLIKEFGEIPLCDCGCGQKINVSLKHRFDYRRRGGYPKFIHNHHCKGENSFYFGLSKEEHPNFGKKHSKETIQKRIESNKKYFKLHPEAKPIGEKNPMFGKSVGKGIPKTAEHNKKNSEAQLGEKNHMFGKIPSPLCGIGKGSYYQSPLQGQVYLRSSYELKYAQYLDSQKILWMYEMETFYLGGYNLHSRFLFSKRK